MARDHRAAVVPELLPAAQGRERDLAASNGVADHEPEAIAVAVGLEL